MEKWIVEIDRMKVRANHGVFPQERVVGNDFEVSLSVEIEAAGMDRAVQADDSNLTVSYADLAAIISGIMADPADLLETVAMRIRTAVTLNFPQIVGGRVKVAKITPPIPVIMAKAAVELQWDCKRNNNRKDQESSTYADGRRYAGKMLCGSLTGD